MKELSILVYKLEHNLELSEEELEYMSDLCFLFQHIQLIIKHIKGDNS